MNPLNLIECLEQKERYTYNEGLIIDFILSHTERVLHMSIYELAEATNSSTSTIVRLCKKTETSGFKEFKIRLSRDLEIHYQAIRNVDANMPFLAQDSDLLIAKKIAQLTTETVQSTQQLLTEAMLNKSIDLLLTAENILAVGVSNSYIRLTDFQTKLLRIQLFIHLIPYQAEQFYLAINATKNDVAILVSYSGNTAEIVNEVRIFAEGGTPIIAITSDLNSQLAKYATVILPIPNVEHADFKVSTFSSQLAIEYILNVLYSCIFSRNFDKNYTSQKNTPTSILKF
ncbi:TPA: MurR/RpiR family transcriptional regulator [Enterococcus faecalis]|uniref:MurR/RpiR family transcriptional regulator n=1 Tax=Enterococcus faecalis TaxID=1351 RepID=UPI00046576B9|nr:MurR/RpiR family transcriptional regulator [Enterococcus faecalis]EGO8956574.1 MurR/RpiR family transcriptional regulator [Enterococcus faecalis]HBI1551735.1 MurR/RpiR family transcriptional regulator [Enterococcus faecalis]HBI1773172.1 MurR/RpiR family transcriptional regulator [Enterococcus faecalis]HBI1794857.1 MurR/RpiR family transcriptional regulator [Enterococcus faecalis]HBI1803337.1 MurR/RpiR family transcriptional regulator [Enterococcus faecalis]